MNVAAVDAAGDVDDDDDDDDWDEESLVVADVSLRVGRGVISGFGALSTRCQ